MQHSERIVLRMQTIKTLKIENPTWRVKNSTHIYKDVMNILFTMSMYICKCLQCLQFNRFRCNYLLELQYFSERCSGSSSSVSSELSMWAGGVDSPVLRTDCVRSGWQRSRLLRGARQRSHANSTQPSDTQSRLVRSHSLPIHATVQPHEGPFTHTT